MTPISNIICEYKLPLERILAEEENEDFKGIEWDELAFDTFSFFSESEFQRSSYFISEDGLIYEHVFNLELKRNQKGELIPEEVDGGLTNLEFTGEIAFGTEIFGKDYDYEMIFKALFFKGDLKELKLDHFSRKDNSTRKKTAKKIQKQVQLQQARKRNPIYLFTLALKFTVASLIQIPKWILFKTFALIMRLELWCKDR